MKNLNPILFAANTKEVVEAVPIISGISGSFANKRKFNTIRTVVIMITVRIFLLKKSNFSKLFAKFIATNIDIKGRAII